MTVITPIRAITSSQKSTEKALCRFAITHAEQLLAASALLGGPLAMHRTFRLLEELTDMPPLTTHLRREFVALHRLLALDGVEDFDSPQAACFAAIDPESSEVEEICALTDALRGHFEALANACEERSVWAALAAA